MKHIALLAALLLAGACAPYQQMRQSYLPTDAAQDQALNECRFLVAQDRAAIDWYMVNRAGTPVTGSDGALTALTPHGMDQMRRCMAVKGYRPGPMVPYGG
jgi:hypothetical protein